MLILSHSVGFFAFEVGWCLILGDVLPVVIVNILKLSVLVFFSLNTSMEFVVLSTLGLPSINKLLTKLRWVLSYFKRREGLFFKAFEVFLVTVFFGVRLAMMWMMFFHGEFYVKFGSQNLHLSADGPVFLTLCAWTIYNILDCVKNYFQHGLYPS